MKRAFLLLFICAAIMACKKTKTEPEGPTDVRIYNNTDQVFDNVIVNTSGGEFNFGTVNSHAYTAYHRYEKAYSKADISLTIGGVTYSTPKQDYTYMNYMGQMKMTYKIYIRNMALKELDTEVVPEGEL
jgi:molybdopterin biosynthesis enzyme